MKIGIIFGGKSREREISFAAGRTVYDNLDKFLFEAVPVFADSLGNFILLEWQHLYRTNIRDFYPPAEAVPNSVHRLPIYIESLGELLPEHEEAIINQVGRRIQPSAFSQYFDFAFLTLSDAAPERNALQTLLKEHKIPYSGSGIFADNLAADKLKQKQELAKHGFGVAPYRLVTTEEWAEAGKRVEHFGALKQELGWPLVLNAPHQSASPYFSVIKEDNFEAFAAGLESCFLQKTIYKETWLKLDSEQQLTFIKDLTDIRKGIGLPVSIGNSTKIYHPEQLLHVVQGLFTQTDRENLTLFSTTPEPYVVIEAFTPGKAFRCLVIQDAEGQPLALLPTGVKSQSGVAAITIPQQCNQDEILLNLIPEDIQRIRQECQRFFKAIGLQVFATVNGIITKAGEIFISSFQTNPELLPSSFVFRQLAIIGLNPSQFLTFIIRTSLRERLRSEPYTTQSEHLLHHLEAALKKQHTGRFHKIKVGILMGENVATPDTAFESGRYVYSQLAASDKYQPVPIFRTTSANKSQHYILPLNFLLMENTGEIKEKITQPQAYQAQDNLLDQIRDGAETITANFASVMLQQPQYINYEQLRNLVDMVFISLPEKEAADGVLQAEFEKLNLPYNGSGLACLQLLNDYSERKEILRLHGLAISNGHHDTGGNNQRWVVTSGLLTRYLPDGRHAYEIFESSGISTENAAFSAEKPFVVWENSFYEPICFTPDPAENQSISEKIKATFKKAAQVLNLEGYAQIDALVFIKGPEEVEIQIKEIHLLPDLTPGSCMFRQGTMNGYKPYDIIDRILQFSLDRYKLKG